MRTPPLKYRALTSREKLAREKYTRLSKYEPGRYGLFLSVGMQSFKIEGDHDGNFTSLRRAEGFRDRLATAIAMIGVDYEHE